jgi:ribonuclease J
MVFVNRMLALDLISGHAGPADLKRFTQALDPKLLVPIHSFHPERYQPIFFEVEAHEDGI